MRIIGSPELENVKKRMKGESFINHFSVSKPAMGF